MSKQKQHASPGHDASTAEAAPGRADRVGVGEHDEEVSGPEVNLIAFPRENGSKGRLRKAEERSQHTKKHPYIYTRIYKVHCCVHECFITKYRQQTMLTLVFKLRARGFKTEW